MLMSLVRSVLAAFVVFSALVIGGCAAEQKPSVVLKDATLSFESFFPKKVDVFALLTDPEYKLPRVLPDGIYLGASLVVVTN